ncbi:MAG: (2Fe-2S)-binding protein, partial [Pseudomonadota bacterium]
ETPHGRMVARARLTEDQKPGEIFAPIHWSGTNASNARVGALLSGPPDPVSGQPESKAMPAKLSRLKTGSHGQICSRAPIAPPDSAYWSLAKTSFGTTTTFAVTEESVDWMSWADGTLPDGERVVFEDHASGVYRMVVFQENRLVAILSVAPKPNQLSATWLDTAFDRAYETPIERRSLLAGRTVDGQSDDGPIVCVCFQVGANAIKAHIGEGCETSEAIGKATCAGTNCGSCVPELRRLINEAVKPNQQAQPVVEAAE